MFPKWEQGSNRWDLSNNAIITTYATGSKYEN